MEIRTIEEVKQFLKEEFELPETTCEIKLDLNNWELLSFSVEED